MPIIINLRHLDEHSVHLEGQLPVEELELGLRDEIIRAEKPLEYDIEVEKLENALLVQGRIRLPLQCECVRCLKQFELMLEIQPWTTHIPLTGEDSAAILNDCVDLTPYVREDILLEFPQHPLCDANCGGWPKAYVGKEKKTATAPETGQKASAWSELDKLKL
jgi:uncharacterized protein